MPMLAAAGDDNAAAPVTRADVDALQKEIDALQKKSNDAVSKTAGWNGEHFYLRSADGEFVLMPMGYVGEQYTYYGDNYGTPANTFAITRAVFGVQGNYGKQLDYAFNFATNSSTAIRDAFLDFKPYNEFKIMAGLNKVPFSMEVGSADTAVEFFNRSIISTLYPDASGTFRAPGVDLHGEVAGGIFEYWAGVFNGQGLLGNGTTNEPELVGRVRFTPWKGSGIGALDKFSFGGSVEHSRSKGINKEQSFSGLLNDSAYTFFPQFNINGNVLRYNAFFSWVTGPLGIRGEYASLTQDRSNIGTLATDGIAFNSQPPVKGSGFYLSGTYLLTGEDEPVNALPRVKHPVIGPNSPGESGTPGWGAWAVKFRYSRMQANAYGSVCDATTIPACPLTPSHPPGFSDTTVQYTGGVNWYLNYWVLLKAEVNVDQLKDPSVGGVMPRNFTVLVTSLQYRF
jgi:phosphate-selective porin